MNLSKEQLGALHDEFRLSPRETQILDLLFQGVGTNAEIGQRLGTSENAIKAAMRTLYLKVRARSKHETVVTCLDLLAGRLAILYPNRRTLDPRDEGARD